MSDVSCSPLFAQTAPIAHGFPSLYSLSFARPAFSVLPLHMGFSHSTLPPSLQHFPRALRRRAPGKEVAALRRIGVAVALGIDLAPASALVAEGDFLAQPFADASFDFEFSNVFDHALYPDRLATEIQRTLRPDGVAVLHVAVHRCGDKYSANDILDLDGVVALFNHSHLLRVSKIDAFGLDTELILRKKMILLQKGVVLNIRIDGAQLDSTCVEMSSIQLMKRMKLLLLKALKQLYYNLLLKFL